MKQFITTSRNADGKETNVGGFTFGITTQGNINNIKVIFCTFDIGKDFYVDYLGALRKCRIKSIYFVDGHYYAGGVEVAEKHIEYEMAGIGTVIISRGLNAYASVEDFRAGKRILQTNKISPEEFKRRITEDVKGSFECEYYAPRTDNCSGSNFRFIVWVWDGTKAVRKEVNHFLLNYDGTRYSIIPQNPIQGAFPTKQLCEQANEIKVVDF